MCIKRVFLRMDERKAKKWLPLALFFLNHQIGANETSVSKV